MSSLSFLIEVASALRNSAFEPVIDVAILIAAVSLAWRTFWRSVFDKNSKEGILLVTHLFVRLQSRINHSIQYAPNLEKWRAKSEPYYDLVISVILSMAMLFSAGVFGYAAVKFQQAPLLARSILILISLASGLYLRTTISAASWALHTIRTGEPRPKLRHGMAAIGLPDDQAENTINKKLDEILTLLQGVAERNQ